MIMTCCDVEQDTAMNRVDKISRAWRQLSHALCIGMWLVLGTAQAAQTQFVPRPSNSVTAQPPSPAPAQYPLQLVLDDNTDEGAFGVTGGVSAQQFMWFNRFTVPVGGDRLQQIWVLFPSGANITVGAPVELAVYTDADSNPANGATLVRTINVTVQAADDLNFSIYDLGQQPVNLPVGSDVLIGVIPRFIVSGTTPPTNPAAVDTTASQGRSWVAVWSGDPPDPPALPPDALITRLDDGLLPGGGNWMIRAFGSALPVQAAIATPTLHTWGLAALFGVLLGVAAWKLRSRRRVI